MNRPTLSMDHLISAFDAALRSLCLPVKRVSKRLNPSDSVAEVPLSAAEKKHVAGLMRINHAGEVCAQALYQGQALTAKCPKIKAQMTEAALEEVDHLAWCESRLSELDSVPGYLNPIWYAGAFTLGLIAGVIGDQWSLGFVAETERQVSDHLMKHLKHLPPQDKKTETLLTQMHEDEARHAESAIDAGAAELPFLIREAMRFASKLMTKTSYYL